MKSETQAGSFADIRPDAGDRVPAVPNDSRSTVFRCRSARCACRRRGPARAPRRARRPTSWAERILALIDHRPRTLGQLRADLAGASTDPGFERALDALTVSFARPGAAWVFTAAGQKAPRLVRVFNPRNKYDAANFRVTGAVLQKSEAV